MKAILEFNLPEDQDEFETASSGANARVGLDEICEACRSVIKYDREVDLKDFAEEIRSIAYAHMRKD